MNDKDIEELNQLDIVKEINNLGTMNGNQFVKFFGSIMLKSKVTGEYYTVPDSLVSQMTVSDIKAFKNGEVHYKIDVDGLVAQRLRRLGI